MPRSICSCLDSPDPGIGSWRRMRVCNRRHYLLFDMSLYPHRDLSKCSPCRSARLYGRIPPMDCRRHLCIHFRLTGICCHRECAGSLHLDRRHPLCRQYRRSICCHREFLRMYHLNRHRLLCTLLHHRILRCYLCTRSLHQPCIYHSCRHYCHSICCYPEFLHMYRLNIYRSLCMLTHRYRLRCYRCTGSLHQRCIRHLCIHFRLSICCCPEFLHTHHLNRYRPLCTLLHHHILRCYRD